MALFRVEHGTLGKVPAKDFTSDAELHKFIDANLEALVGIRSLGAEFPIPGGRIGTLGLDEHNVPGVFEYKKDRRL